MAIKKTINTENKEILAETKSDEAPFASAEASPESEIQPKVDNDKQSFKPKALDPHMLVNVKNGFQGRLVYVSKRTGERFIWDEFGAELDMELIELKSAKSSSKGYFANNWFMFDDPEVIDYLGVAQQYKFALAIDKFDDLFVSSPDEIAEKISKLSSGQKKSIAYRAKQLIAEGGIDSNKAITALEKSLGMSLVER